MRAAPLGPMTQHPARARAASSPGPCALAGYLDTAIGDQFRHNAQRTAAGLGLSQPDNADDYEALIIKLGGFQTK